MFTVSLFSIVETIDDVREYMGISYIKAYLESMNIICNSQVITRDEIDDILNQYDDNEFPNLIGVSMYCNNHSLVKHFCSKIKKVAPLCHVCVGGPHVYDYEYEILIDCPFIDSVCTGEGEKTFYDLANRLMSNESLIGCDGITFRQGNEITKNKKRVPIKNLDELPFPYRERNPKNKKKYFYVTGSRGCLGRCIFCAEYVTGGPNVRLRSPENIVDEIELLTRKYNINKIHFTDATFEDPGEVGLARAKGIFNEIIKRKLKIRMVMYTRCQLVNQFSDDYYELAYKAGVECFFVGIESGNDADMKMYSKKASVQDNLKAIKKIMKHNIYVNYGFICFNPYSTFDSIQQNLDFLRNSGLIFNTYHILSKLTIMPQATMKSKLLSDGLIDEFHYNSSITEYKFIHPEVKEFHKCLKDNLNVKHLIDYDSQIYIDYNHIKKEMPELYCNQLKPIFDSILGVWKERGEYLHCFFSKCIQIYKESNSKDILEKYIKLNSIQYYDQQLKRLYLKYLYILKKEGVNLSNLSIL